MSSLAIVFDLDGAAPRRGSVADQLAANTSANAGRAPGEDFGLAVGLDAAELAKGNTASNLMSVDSNQVRANSTRSTSRSPSFSLPPKSPSSRRSSSRSATAAAADDERSGVRQQANEMQVGDQDDGEVEEEDADPESKSPQLLHLICVVEAGILTKASLNWGWGVVMTAQAKHAAFTAKRNQHYGNEAEAMKIAAALAAYQDEDDEEEVNNEI